MIGLDTETRVRGNKIRIGFLYKGDTGEPITGQTYKSYNQTLQALKQQCLAYLALYPEVTCIQFDPKEDPTKRTQHQRELIWIRALKQWQPKGWIVDKPDQYLEFHWPAQVTSTPPSPRTLQSL